MGHSYSNVLVHVVFSTKNRAKIIPPDRQEDLWRYMVGIGKNFKVNVIALRFFLLQADGRMPSADGRS